MSGTGKKWENMDITKDEVDRIGKALKDEEFRKMFVEYAEEIADPKNRELYEREIAQMEADRGMDVQFIHPKPGHVLKVMAKSSGSPESSKVFINICQNEFIAGPSHDKKQQSSGKMGLQWSIPHSFSPAREDLDKKGKKCAVYDVVFNPDTYKMSSNPGFQNMLHDTAIEGLEKQFGLQIEKQSLVKLQHMNFKGRVEPTVMRKKKEGGADSQSTNGSANKENDPLSSFPYPYEQGVTSEELAKKKANQVEEDKKRKQARKEAKEQPKGSEKTSGDGVIIPEYSITNRYGMDMADYSQSLAGTPMPLNNAPSELVVSIHLPQLDSAAQCNLDVTERNLTLESTKPVKCKLSLRLPYPVDDENGSAKFDKTKKKLVVTLPVRREKVRKELEETTTKSLPDSIDMMSEGGNGVPHAPLIEELPSTNVQLHVETAAVLDDPSIQDSTEDTQDSTEDTQDSTEDTQDSTEDTQEQLKSTQAINDTNCDTSCKLCLDTKISYKTPKFTFDQDEEMVTLIIDVPRVNQQTYKSAYHENMMEIMFATASPSGFPTNYYLKCVFPHPVDEVTKCVGETNMVLTIQKTTSALWDSFSSGGSDSLEKQENKFLTKADIINDLKELESRQRVEDEQPKVRRDAQEGTMQERSVVDAEPMNLTIDVKAAKGGSVENDSLISPPLVVHKHSPRNITGILKRTLSESSGDDLHHTLNGVGCGDSAQKIAEDQDKLTVGTSSGNNSSSSSSPVDLPSPRERKKSVSFSDKVEEAMFKSKDSVCHMHKTLLNRRKKQRQRENRKGNQERIRRTSSTEHSSGDEQHEKRKGGNGMRRRRHSSSTSEDCTLSPRSPTTDLMTSSTEFANGEDVCTCSAEDSKNASLDTPSEPSESDGKKPVLNSDDDEDGYHENDQSSTSSGADSSNTKAATNWSNTSEFVEKTKCAFDFHNSVIFDLDE